MSIPMNSCTVQGWVEVYRTSWFLKNIVFCKLRIYRTFAISNKNVGPCVFDIASVNCINLMVDKARSLEIYLYADDLEIYNEIKSSDNAEDLQNGLDNLYD